MRRNKNSLSTLSRLLVFVLFLAYTSVTLQVQAPDYVELQPIADSYVSSTRQDSNFGSSESLLVESSNGNQSFALLMFNLSQIPSGLTVYNVRLVLYAQRTSMIPSISAYCCSESGWTEEEITYNNMPSIITPALDTSGISYSGFLAFNVTQHTVSVLQGADKRVTLELRANTNGSAVFLSREAPYFTPRLSIEYLTPPWIISNNVIITFGVFWLMSGAIALGIGYMIYRIRRPVKPLPPVPRSWHMRKRCLKCGRELPHGAEYCPVCVPTVEATEIVRPKPVKLWLLNFGRVLAFAAGFISLFAGVANFALSAAVYSNSTYTGIPEVAGYFNLLIVMFFASALLCLVGHGFGWSLGLNPWESEHKRAIVIEITFLACLGFVNLVEGVIIQGFIAWGPSMFWGPTGVGSVMIWLIAFPMAILTMISLFLTTLLEKD